MKRGILSHRLFLVGIFFKGLNGTLEIIGGFILLFINPEFLKKSIGLLFRPEFIGDYLFNIYNISKNTQNFAAFYLFAHGIIKIAIVSGLYLKILWVYPLSQFILAILVTYQLYRFSYTHSILLFFLTTLDIIIIFLIHLENKRLKKLSLHL